jgi:hypothetical protein
MAAPVAAAVARVARALVPVTAFLTAQTLMVVVFLLSGHQTPRATHCPAAANDNNIIITSNNIELHNLLSNSIKGRNIARIDEESLTTLENYAAHQLRRVTATVKGEMSLVGSRAIADR